MIIILYKSRQLLTLLPSSSPRFCRHVMDLRPQTLSPLGLMSPRNLLVARDSQPSSGNGGAEVKEAVPLSSFVVVFSPALGRSFTVASSLGEGGVRDDGAGLRPSSSST